MNVAKAVGKTINAISVVSPNTAGKLTLNLFCRPHKGRQFTKKEQEFINKAKWKELYLDGKKMQCYIWGEGSKKIFLAHGFNSNAARWRPLVGMLQSAGYQVIAMDVPAHGNSDWNRVNGLLYAQTLQVAFKHFNPDYIVGHSFAGIAITYYYSHMEALPVEKIILMGVPNELTDVSNVYFNELSLNKRVRKAYFKAFEDTYNYKTDYFTLSNLIKNNNTPGLIIHDEADDIASYEGAKVLHQSWKNSRFLGTTKLGHSLQGRQVYKAILDFIS